ncbi:hypothetical protein [Leptolyngbya sp. DQ-M1]|uniref:hypothetical protein n=1 Tax=Leptolyngbya sp. DQ-M1 TaxID=2933920 RepID=UPI003297F163
MQQYWLIDPEREVVIVLQLEAEHYVEVGQFRRSEMVISPTFSRLQLTAEAVLRAGR